MARERQHMTFSLALSGDAIINRRISTCQDPGFRKLVDIFRSSDVSITHLETLIHDFDGPETYPAAEAGGTWMRSPAYVADELSWAGFDLVSHASNHALDYGYGALRSTWEALDRAEIGYAGTGDTLADARSPAYLDTAYGRVAMLSMTSSFPPWARAGERRPDMGGRPGLNPLRWYHEVDRDTFSAITDLATQMGQWVIELDDDYWGIHPPGLHNTLTRYRIGDVDRPVRVLDERDRTGNLSAIREASAQADLVIAHIHSHEWDPDGDLADSPAFLETFARDAIDHGADLVLNQGTHAPLRGVEVYNGCPIWYDPGDLMMMNRSGISLPMDFYRRFEPSLAGDPWEETPSSAQAARPPAYNTAENPAGGYQSVPVEGLVVPVCEFDEDLVFEKATLYPATLLDTPNGYSGIPSLVEGEKAQEILSFVQERSRRYETAVEIASGHGTLRAH